MDFKLFDRVAVNISDTALSLFEYQLSKNIIISLLHSKWYRQFLACFLFCLSLSCFVEAMFPVVQAGLNSMCIPG